MRARSREQQGPSAASRDQAGAWGPEVRTWLDVVASCALSVSISNLTSVILYAYVHSVRIMRSINMTTMCTYVKLSNICTQTDHPWITRWKPKHMLVFWNVFNWLPCLPSWRLFPSLPSSRSLSCPWWLARGRRQKRETPERCWLEESLLLWYTGANDTALSWVVFDTTETKMQKKNIWPHKATSMV